MNGMVCEWIGLWIEWSVEKTKQQQRMISFKIYNPDILLFLKIEIGAEFGW